MIFLRIAVRQVRVMVRCALWTGGLLATTAWAATDEIPSGLPVGPWIISPSIGLSAAYDSNPFYRNNLDLDAAVDDQVLKVLPVIKAVLPFRNSRLDLSYEGSRTDYKVEKQPQSWNHVLKADLGLLFSSMDRLTTSAEWSSGLSEVRLFDGGETVYDGVPFTYWTFGVEGKREVAGTRGYRAGLEHSSLSYDQTQFSFFEFDGNELELEYLEPRTATRWLSALLTVRRFDHFDSTSDVRELFRKEESEAVWLGISNGEGGGPFQLDAHVGWGSWRFPGGEGRDYEGPTADIEMVFVPHGASRYDVRLERKVWPSFYGPNNYYLATSVTARLDQSLGPGLQLVANINWSALQYDEPFPDDVLRSDHALALDVYATLQLAHRIGLIWGVSSARRSSTEPSVEYRRTAISLGMAWGWL